MKTETEWAIRNLELAGLFGKGSEYEGYIGECIKEILLVIQKQGHSGHSHFLTLNILSSIAAGKSLTLEHWKERFDAFSEFYKETSGEEISEKEYINLGYPKPKIAVDIKS